MNLMAEHEALERMREQRLAVSAPRLEAAELARNLQRERTARVWERLAQWAHRRADRTRGA